MIDVTTTFAVISWKKEVYRNMIADKIKNARTIKKLTQEQVAEDLNVSRQTISNWENGCSVPDSSMLISLADELDTSVSILLGENVSESPADDLKLISEKLEMINSKLAKKSIMKLRMLRGGLITLCILIVITFIVLTVMHSSYLDWNFDNPEIAVAGTILHGFEFLFVRIAPVIFLISIVGIICTYKKRII